MQRKEQVRKESGGPEVAHLRRARVQCEDGREGQRDQRDLVAEERDGLSEPEAAEVALAQHRGDADETVGRCERRGRGELVAAHALRTLTSPLIDAARSSTSGASSAGCSSPSSSSELKS